MRVRREICLTTLLLLGCSKPSTPAPEQAPSAKLEPAPSSAKVVVHPSAAAAESAAPAPSSDPGAGKDFVLYQDLKARFFPVGNAVIACGLPCSYPTQPDQKVWLLTGDEPKERPELWPRTLWKAFDANLKANDLVPDVTYGGEWPNHLWVWAGTGSRTGEGTLPSANFERGRWVDSSDMFSADHPLPPRKYDEILLSAPSPSDPTQTFVYGGDGPPMVVPAHMLFTYRKGKWEKRFAPWGENARVTRLENGNTIVVTEFSYLVTPDQKIRKLEVEEKHAQVIVRLGAVAWLAGQLKLSKPVKSEDFKLAKLERRASPPDVEPLTASSPAESFLEDPVDYSDGCKTPIIEVRRNSHQVDYGFDYKLRVIMQQHAKEASQLVGYEAHLKSGFALLFSAKDVALLKQFVEWWQPAAEPKLKCLDVAALMPDPYAPTPKLRRKFYHPWSARALELLEGR